MWENKGIKLVRDQYIMTHLERGKIYIFNMEKRNIVSGLCDDQPAPDPV
jgi:hypothetical protein